MIDDDDPEGATPLSPDEKEGLKAKHIRTRGELDELEQTNITQGVIKLRKKNSRIDPGDALNVSFVCDLHKDMFGRVWTWAGEFRRTEKNIGIDPLFISVELRNLLDDVKAWVEFETYPGMEATLMFHHRLVKIHPFPNGNGRYSRIYAEFIGQNFFGIKQVDWGGEILNVDGDIRRRYIEALRSADGGDYAPLFELYTPQK
ncbi:MAG TPA: mobile mystery protein B [Marinobacter sp.]|uniref:mobile mystery protein B n=1 Tax=Marinobacter sp. TaxID=50741 RepID=UPI00260B798B|nr:mobile mystery protein B [Marinobacter sp.]HET8800422.1 mobile mystery protein B [Marinobacter sp.]